MDSLLTVAKPDGFPVGMICKLIAHPHAPYKGILVRITGEAHTGVANEYHPEYRPDGTSSIIHGQFVETVDGRCRAFFALSWLRPATPEEISTLTNTGNNDG